MHVAGRGKTAVAVVTQEFEGLARTMAKNAGRSGLRLVGLPYPLDTLPEHEVRQIAKEHFGGLLLALGTTQ